MKTTTFVSAISAALILLGSSSVNADASKEAIPGPHGTFYDSHASKNYSTDAAKVTNFRRREMRSISGHYRSLEAVIKYGAPFQEALSPHVDALQALASQLPNNFPAGTEMQEGKWGAKLVIWEDPTEFKKHIASFQQSIDNLKKTISAGDQSGMSDMLKLVRHECLACHSEFRQRKKK